LPRSLIVAALVVSVACASVACARQLSGGARGAGGAPNVLRVLVTEVTSTRGHVRIDVCTRTEFLKDCHVSSAAPATLGTTVVLVRDLPPGVYAIQAYHDRNDNQSVDRDFLGFPTEAVGFSNDAPIRFKPPSFKDAAFTYAGGEGTLTLRLRQFHP
jgi:uncharacterized protein (DUF2141 family)